MHKSRGASRFCRNFLFLSAEKFSEGILLFLRMFLVSESFMDEKSRGVSRFSVENFCSHSAEKFRWHTINVSETLEYRKIFTHNRGITCFRGKYLISQCQKVPWAFLQCFRNFWGIEKFLCIIGVSRVSVENI